MHVITQSSVLFLWMITMTSVKSQAIKCRLSVALEGTSYDPAYRNVFSPGDTLRVNCGEKYWISEPEHTSAVTTCGEDGEWTIRPVCQEVRCSSRRQPHVYHFSIYWGQIITLDETVGYSCRRGYQSPDDRNLATCTRKGWRPDPLCQEITCEIPVIENGFVHDKKLKYNEKDILHFTCNPSFKPAEDRLPNCTKFGSRAEWSPTPLCERLKCRLSVALEGTSYDPAHRNVFSPGDTLRVNCGEKYWISQPEYNSAVTTCGEDGEWTIRPVCQEVRCSNQRQRHVYYWNVYRGQIITLDETVGYSCYRGYKSPDGRNLATCTRKGWRPDPLCQALAHCSSPPKVERAFILTDSKDEYSSGSEVTYHCHDNYTMVGENTIQCKNGTWQEKNINCTLSKLLRCGTPPFLEDGGYKYITKSHYDHYERVEYMCQPYYTIEGDPYKTCISGEWTGYMRCLKPCIAKEDNFRRHNITLKSNDRKFFTHDEHIEFMCTTGVPVGEMALHQRCNSGVIYLPTCQ